MSDVKKIVASIQDAVDTLSSSAEIRQDTLFKELIGLTKTLETRGDVLLNSIKNLGVINKIKIKLERLIIDPKYKEDVKKFIGSYSGIQDLSNQYFSQFNAKYKPSATANGVKQTAIQSTLNGLFENGINTGVIDGLKKILQTNISAGGSYAHLTEQLRNYMLTNDTGEGALQRYVKTYANTAINQFSAEYNKTIADDLGLEWYGYDGSLLTTSREFCDKCVEKKYIHVSEFPAIIAGNFGALGEIHITKSTGLPDGMMAGTDETNLVRRRGGWNCGHQMIAVAESVVPQSIRDTVYVTQAYKDWASKNGKEAREAEIPQPKNKTIYDINHDKVANILSVKQDEPMSFEDANKLKGNINYNKGYEYRINCQVSVVANELRRRGFDVTALPNTKKSGDVPNMLSRKTEKIWIESESGGTPKKLNAKGNTIGKITKEVDNLTKEVGRYHIDWTWKGQRSGHIITLERFSNNRIRLYDPQTGELKYWNELSKKIRLDRGVNVLRVDNLLVNTDIIDGAVTKLG